MSWSSLNGRTFLQAHSLPHVSALSLVTALMRHFLPILDTSCTGQLLLNAAVRLMQNSCQQGLVHATH